MGQRLFLLSILSLLITAGIYPSLAQPNQGQNNNLNWIAGKSKQKSDNPEFKAERMVSPIDLPSVPPYPGKTKFLLGTEFPNAKNGASITMEFAAQDPPEQILNWYKQNLKQNGWVMQDAMSNATMVAAMKQNNIFQVSVLPPTLPGWQSRLLIRYRFFNKQ